MDIVCYIKEPSHVLKLHNFLIRKWGKVLEGVKTGVKQGSKQAGLISIIERYKKIFTSGP